MVYEKTTIHTFTMVIIRTTLNSIASTGVLHTGRLCLTILIIHGACHKY